MNDRTVRLRPHHLICFQFYRGQGYDSAFTKNLTLVVSDLLSGAPATVVSGADMVCDVCPGLDKDRLCTDIAAGGEDEVRRMDELALRLLGVDVGDSVTLSEVADRLVRDPDATARWRDECCASCIWAEVCESGWGELLAEEGWAKIDRHVVS